MAVEAVSVLESRPLRRERGPEEGRGLAGGFSFFGFWICWAWFGVPRQPADLTLLLFMRRAGDKPGPVAFRIFKR